MRAGGGGGGGGKESLDYTRGKKKRKDLKAMRVNKTFS